MEKVRVMHYINQFFAGVGSEDKADLALTFREGAMGPGKRLQSLLGDSAEVVITVYCGDNYFAKHYDEAVERLLQIARDYEAKIVVAGPAFASGRYGFTCVEICHALSASVGLDCITGFHAENPAIEGYRQYKDRRFFAFPTAESVSGMDEALSTMARFVFKFAAGSAIGSASEEGYIPRGFRVVEVVEKSSAERAVDMLLDKMADRSFSTEIPIGSLEKVLVAPPTDNLGNATLALVSTAGVVPAGNPDGFKMHRNTHWKKYSIAGLNSMKDAQWEVRHGGYNTAFMSDDANYGVPVDVCRKLETEGAFSKLYPYFYTIPGINGLISVMQEVGKEIASDMKAEGVDAALLVST